MTDIRLRVVDIIDGTTVDGPGFRTAIYFAGCEHHCCGCQNPSTWDPLSGNLFTLDQLMSIIDDNDYDVTFSGGDPLFQVEAVTILAKQIKKAGRNIWCYTGYRFEEVVASPRLKAILDFVDVLVDGRFDQDFADKDLLFRGSSNQRLVDVDHWRKTGEIRSWESDF